MYSRFCLTTTKIWNCGPVLQLGSELRLYSFGKTKDSTPLEAWGRPTFKSILNCPGSLFLYVFVSSPEPALLKLG